MTHKTPVASGLAPVNGINLYYEIYGEGLPLILIHGGGSTIQTCFGRVIPDLARYFQVIAMDLQNHGRSGFRDVPQTFDQDAEDVVGLLDFLKIKEANFLGFSNGATTALRIAFRFPDRVIRLVAASCVTRRSGFPQGFFEWMKAGTLEHMPDQLKTGFLEVTPDTTLLQTMFERDRDRMIQFQDIPDSELSAINAPTLILNAEADVPSLNHALEMKGLIPGSQLALLPGGHGGYMGEITTISKPKPYSYPLVPVVLDFLLGY